MSRKPEARYVTGVNKHVRIHHQGMYTPYYAGTPDQYYSAVRDLWVEYKWLAQAPPIIDPVALLSKQQFVWIRDRRNEGRNIWQIIGCPQGGIILDDFGQWDRDCVAWLDKKTIAQQIEVFCNDKRRRRAKN